MELAAGVGNTRPAAIAQATGGSYFDAPIGPELSDTLKSALGACKKIAVTLPPKPG